MRPRDISLPNDVIDRIVIRDLKHTVDLIINNAEDSNMIPIILSMIVTIEFYLAGEGWTDYSNEVMPRVKDLMAKFNVEFK